MADLLIRDIPDEVVAAIDAKAKRIGISRSEFVRRTLARENVTASGAVTADDLVRFSGRFTDLADEEVMRQAWE